MKPRIYKGATGYWVVNYLGNVWYMMEWSHAIKVACLVAGKSGIQCDRIEEKWQVPPRFWKNRAAGFSGQ